MEIFEDPFEELLENSFDINLTKTLGPKMFIPEDNPIMLDCNIKFAPFEVAYRIYGKLNKNKSNAILICHALTGDQYVAETHPITNKPGWWEIVVGPDKIIDTNRYFVICSNILGGCMGTTGPASINSSTNSIWGLDFPIVTISDMVKAQKRLIEHLGINKLLCVIGGSTGGMQVLEWASKYPENLASAIAVATSFRQTAQNIALHEVGRQAIKWDPNWNRGRYDKQPVRGLALARMIAHISYLSDVLLQSKFGRSLHKKDTLSFNFHPDFEIEHYLHYQGKSFVKRFDANSYMYITKAVDYFNLADANGGYLGNAFIKSNNRFLIVSFTSDWLFPISESRLIVEALNEIGADVSFIEIESLKGHDAFLLEEPLFHSHLGSFLNEIALEHL